jgi:hypothetical protein
MFCEILRYIETGQFPCRRTESTVPDSQKNSALVLELVVETVWDGLVPRFGDQRRQAATARSSRVRQTK